MRFLFLLGVCFTLTLTACASIRGVPPSPGDCVTIRLWSNGWHANLALPAELFDASHPFRKLFPDAQYFLIGWGARDFYMARDAGVWEGIKAIIPPTRSAIHIIAGATPVEDSLWPPRDLAVLAVSRSSAEEMADGLAELLYYNEDGAPIVLGEGRVSGKSHFLESRGGFHLFNMCNHWTAKRLREAGVPLRVRISFTASGLMDAARRKTQPNCSFPPEGAPTQGMAQ